MKQSFWAKIAFKNIFENKKFHLANLVVNVFTVITLYLYVFVSTNPGLKNAKGYDSLKMILSLGCIFLVGVTVMFKSYTNRIFVKRRNKELGLYAVWGLEPKHINSILAFETLYMYIFSVSLGLLIGVISQRFIYETLFSLMRCSSKYESTFLPKNFWVTMLVFLGIDSYILLKNMITVSNQKVINLLKGEDSRQIVKNLKAADILKGVLGVSLIAGAYIYVNTTGDVLNSISAIFAALIVLFIGSYLVISCFVVMAEFFLKKQDRVYYRNTFFTTIAKLISRTKNNALSLAVINILFTCVVIGASTTIALYLGTDRQASAAYNVDGYINTTSREDLGLVEEAVRKAADEAGAQVELLRTTDEYAFQTIFDPEKCSFSNENEAVRDLPEVIVFVSLDEFNKYEKTDLSLEEDEAFFIFDEDVTAKNLEYLDIYGRKTKVKQVLEGPTYLDVDNIKYAYSYKVILKNYKAIENMHEYISGQGNPREIFHYVEYNIAGTMEDEIRVEDILDDELKKIDSVDFYDSNATQKRTRYERNAIFLFLGAFISLIFVMYMIFIMYYKQIQEAVDDAENVRIMQKIGMSVSEIKRCIMAENGILFFIPIVMAFAHVIACFKMITDILKLFMLTDMNFAGLCIFVFSFAIFGVYMLMYVGAYKVYTGIVLHDKMP